MDLQFVSLTGADDLVDPAALLSLSEQYPFVEWAILSSQKMQGRSRYPTEAWVEQFHAVCPHVRKAVHLCGKDVDAFLASDPRILAKVSKFDRVQLNFNQRRQPKDLSALVRVANSIPQPIILQHNSANAGLWDELRGKLNRLTILFDASGGRGVAPHQGWPAMLDDTVCGFAGGLGPANVERELQAICRVAGGRRFWLDMESKLRTPVDDAFSQAACEEVLARVRATISGAART